MALVHTICLGHGDVAKRKSENRRYEACLTATVTELTVEHAADQRIDVAAKLTRHRAELAALLTLHHTTVAEARATLKTLTDSWYVRKMPALGAMLTSTRLAGNHLHDATDRKLESEGLENPYKSTWHAIDVLAGDIEGCERALKNWKTPVPGSELALSWHLTRANAQRAAGESNANYYKARGYHVAVRSDFEVRETAKKAERRA